MSKEDETLDNVDIEQTAEDASQTKTSSNTKRQFDYSVVGIGASAGGLSAIRNLFQALPSDTGLVFVVVMHLSPQYESQLAELLQPHTSMRVRQVTERVEMQPNHVYIIPPAKKLLVKDGHLDLADIDRDQSPVLQVDDFFRSLAEEHGDGVAVVLSGSGSDGAVGIQKIKEKGGLIFAQSPEEAEFDGMPKSAIGTGLVDVIKPVAQLAEQIVAAKRTFANLDLPAASQDLPVPARETLTKILEHIQRHTGQDFSHYKEATLRRRLVRRMQLVNTPTLTAYLEYMSKNSNEAHNLFEDLLIHVTEYFRDPEAWLFIEREIIPKLFIDKTENDSVRAWVVGCATGEEAYSLAMSLYEYAETLSKPPRIQIFATDLGERVLNYARAGIYPDAIAAHVSPEKLERFFHKEGNHYRVRKDLRDLVLFSAHNLLQDPPFSQLDLIVCRNLFIYFKRKSQEQAFEYFHYGLRLDGYLFLGSAESADDVSLLFEPVHKDHRLYRRSEATRHKIILPGLPTTSQQKPPVMLPQVLKQGTAHASDHIRGLEEVGLPSLLVSEQYAVLHYSETAGRYLQHPAGTPTEDVSRLVRPEMQGELLSALHHAFEKGRPTRTQAIPVKFNGKPRPVTILVRPIPNQSRALILFWEEDADKLEQSRDENISSSADVVHRLEIELRTAQQRLQSTHQQHEATVEELRAANEELQSTNEEYRATLEELETGKEELQSMNEELHTVNQELKSKVEEGLIIQSDLQNLFVSTGIATLFLDRQLRVKRYTPRIAEIFNLMPADQNRPIQHLTRNVNYEALESDARRVIENLAPIEHEIQDNQGRWYLVTVRPYRTIDERIDGVVITFVDVSTQKEWADLLEDRVTERTQQVQGLAGEILRIEQRVQQRIARVLHDDLQQHLYSTRMHLEMTKQDVLTDNLSDIENSFAYLDQLVGDTIYLTRYLTQDLAPPTLDNNDLYESLQWLGTRSQEMHGLEVEIEAHDNPPVTYQTALLGYHCVRELLFNVVKHANVDEVKIEMRQVDQNLHVIVRDHGVGFDVNSLSQRDPQESGGYGLLYLRERLAYHGAELRLESTPGQGTEACLILPLQPS